jgi:imidazolonepropionase-like amidohydrolase
MSLMVYKNAELIPIVQDGILHGYDLFIKDGIIIQVVKSSVDIPVDAMQIDCTSKFVMPGLIDAHFHLLPGCENDLKMLLAYGVTSVRNMWGSQAVDLETPGVDSKKIREDLATGRMIGPSLVNTSRILDGASTVKLGNRSINTINDASLFIKEALQEGASQLKVYKHIQPKILDSLYELGAEYGLRIVGHVPDAVLPEVFFSKAHSVEHTMTFSQADVRALYRSKCYFVPTLVGEKKLDILAFGNIHSLMLEGQAQNRYVNPATAKVWEEMGSAKMQENIKSLCDYTQARQKVKTYVAMGGIPAVGTNFPNPYCYPGISLHEELGLLTECGLSPQQILFGATLQGARVLEIEDKKGTLEIGKDADLLVLNSNPLESISNSLNIDAVVLRGRHFDRAALKGLLDEVEQGVWRAHAEMSY